LCGVVLCGHLAAVDDVLHFSPVVIESDHGGFAFVLVAIRSEEHHGVSERQRQREREREREIDREIDRERERERERKREGGYLARSTSSTASLIEVTMSTKMSASTVLKPSRGLVKRKVAYVPMS
jgi:hypothetical protein